MTPTYPITVCRFPLFIALCDHNPPTLQTDRQMDRRRARSIYKRDILISHVTLNDCQDEPLCASTCDSSKVRPISSQSCTHTPHTHTETTALRWSAIRRSLFSFFSARCIIYISCLCYDVSVRLSVCDGSALAHYSKFRFQIPIPIYRALRSRCMRARGEGIHAGKSGGIISRYASHC